MRILPSPPTVWYVSSFSDFVCFAFSKKGEDQAEISNLQEGQYVFQLTVTDSAGQQDSSNITIMVLTAEQTEGESTQIDL